MNPGTIFLLNQEQNFLQSIRRKDRKKNQTNKPGVNTASDLSFKSGLVFYVT